jgi:hypothetical protein
VRIDKYKFTWDDIAGVYDYKPEIFIRKGSEILSIQSDQDGLHIFVLDRGLGERKRVTLFLLITGIEYEENEFDDEKFVYHSSVKYTGDEYLHIFCNEFV